MNNKTDFTKMQAVLENALKGCSDVDHVDYKDLTTKIMDEIRSEALRSQLEIYYEYEKHYLDMLKEYKEEIKFAATIQEEVRKERANFFSEKLKEVSATLKESGVEDSVRCMWIKNLVNSYTDSLDMSERLVDEGVFNTLNDIKQNEKKIVNSIKNKEE